MFRIRRSGLPALLLLGGFLVVLISYRVTVVDLYTLWFSSGSTTYSHGALLLPVAAYLFYVQWKALDLGGCRASVMGAAAVAMLSFMWFLALLGGVVAAQNALFIALFPALVWAFLGWRIMRHLAFPFVLLLCAIPVWDVINQGVMQLLNAALVEQLLELSGISVYREGITLNISNGAFKVEENCSGMHQLVVAIPIALIYAHLNRFSALLMTAYAVIGALLSVMVNVVRIYIVVVSGYLTDMQHYFVREDHITLGWALFGIAILLFLAVSNRVFGRKEQKPEPIAAASDATFAIGRGAAAGIAGLLLAPVLVLVYAQRPVPVVDAVGIVSPTTIADWAGQELVEPDYIPAYQQGDVVRHAVYANPDGETVTAYISYFASQRQDHEAVSTINKLADGVRWQSGLAQPYAMTIDGVNFQVREAVIHGPGGREKVVWQWYYALGRHTANSAWAKVLGTAGDLFYRRDITVFALSTDIGVNLEHSRKRLMKFTTAALPHLVDMIRTLETN